MGKKESSGVKSDCFASLKQTKEGWWNILLGQKIEGGR